jgi:D-alanyl-D-alanine carboxypeptidase
MREFSMTYFLVPRKLSSPRAFAQFTLACAVALGIGAKVLADNAFSADELTLGSPSTQGLVNALKVPTPGGFDGAVIAGIDVTAEDGYIMTGEPISPFDTTAPAVVNLDPALLDALRQAATDARAEGITVVVNSGWRSETYQQALLDEAIGTYGNEEEALKWVDTPERSNHVKGEAVDIGFTDADYWMIDNGSDYGLCQTYANEIWHFQLMTTPGGTCPDPVEDASAR